MPKREDILEQLKTDFLKIQVSNGYDTDVGQVERSFVTEDKALNRPFLCFLNTDSNKIADYMGGGARRRLVLQVFGYVDVEPPDHRGIDRFVADVEKFLESSDNTQTGSAGGGIWTEVKNIRIFEGTLQDRVAAFRMEVHMEYGYLTSSP